MRPRISGALAILILVVGVSPAATLAAQIRTPDGIGKVLDLVYRGKVLDLVYRVEDMGGAVQNLQVQETATEVHIDLPADILFDFDKSDILPRAQKALHQAAGIIQQRAKGTVRIEGHTDSKGSSAYNQALSERRAVAVKEWLVNKEGLRTVPFVTQGFGATRPRVPNTKPDGSDDPQGRQQNRRVEIILVKK